MQQLLTSWDDYDKENLKLAYILKQLGIPATFYIELKPHKTVGDTQEDAIKQIKELHEMGFEIGGHSYTHPRDLKILSDEDLEREVITSTEIIEDAIGESLESFAYPRGRFDDRVKEVVKKAGYRYARTTKIGDCTDLSDPYNIATTIHVFDRKEYNGRDWLDLAKEHWDSGKDMHLWGHLWEVRANRQFLRLQEFFKYVTKI